MINLDQKQEVILKSFRKGKLQRQICKETGICRQTIRKYIRNYEDKLVTIKENLDEIGKTDIIDDLTSKPKYHSSARTKKALTEEVIEKLKQFLKDDDQKHLTGLSKQQMKKNSYV